MNWKSRPARAPDLAATAAQMRYADQTPWPVALGGGEMRLYRQLRATLPVIDAAVNKLVRLVGGFEVRCDDPAAERKLREALRVIPVGYGQRGIGQFLNAYLAGLLVDGCAIGEMVVQDGHLVGLCWGDVAKIELQCGENPLEMVICQRELERRNRCLCSICCCLPPSIRSRDTRSECHCCAVRPRWRRF